MACLPHGRLRHAPGCPDDIVTGHLSFSKGSTVVRATWIDMGCYAPMRSAQSVQPDTSGTIAGGYNGLAPNAWSYLSER
jgi:hypothetical protein